MDGEAPKTPTLWVFVAFYGAPNLLIVIVVIVIAGYVRRQT